MSWIAGRRPVDPTNQEDAWHPIARDLAAASSLLLQGRKPMDHLVRLPNGDANADGVLFLLADHTTNEIGKGKNRLRLVDE